MADDGWKSPEAIMFGANAFCGYRIAHKLVEKGILTQSEAAAIMVQTADDVRNGTEGDKGEAFGATIAGRYELFAGWLLGQTPTL